MQIENATAHKIHVFFSTHAGVGATTIVHSLADKISNLTEFKVGILHLNPYNEGLLKKTDGRSLDEIYIYLKNGSLTEQMLQNYLSKKSKFFVLQGNRELGKIYEYKPEHIKQLIDLVANLMDIVFLDVGPNMDNPLAIQGMLSGDVHYLIATQEEKSIHSFIKTYEQILSKFNLDLNNFFLVTNKVHKSFSLTPKFIAQKTNTKELVSIPRIDDVYIQEVDSQNKYLHVDKKANEVITKLANSLNIDLQQEKPIKKKSFLSILRA